MLLSTSHELKKGKQENEKEPLGSAYAVRSA